MDDMDRDTPSCDFRVFGDLFLVTIRVADKDIRAVGNATHGDRLALTVHQDGPADAYTNIHFHVWDNPDAADNTPPEEVDSVQKP